MVGTFTKSTTAAGDIFGSLIGASHQSIHIKKSWLVFWNLIGTPFSNGVPINFGGIDNPFVGRILGSIKPQKVVLENYPFGWFWKKIFNVFSSAVQA